MPFQGDQALAYHFETIEFLDGSRDLSGKCATSTPVSKESDDPC
jgi:hypothetical protein